MKPPPFDYVEPAELDAAVELLAVDEGARLLAGGQSLVPMMSFRLVRPTTLVGLRRVTALQDISSRSGEIVLGAMLSQRAALASPEVATRCPLAIDAIRLIGHPQIRSRGTIGGSLAHADPAAELPAVLVALDGAVTVRGPTGSRLIRAEELFAGYYTTSLLPGEILTQAHFPAVPPRTGTACMEISRCPGDFAIAGAACQVTLTDEGTIGNARIALFGVAGAPVRARAAEDAVAGLPPSQDTWERAAAAITEGWSGPAAQTEDGRYRVRVAPVIVRRALAAATERAT